jgi:hypothetical protein
MWFSSGSCGLIVVLYQVAGVLPAQTYDRSWPAGDLRLKGLTPGLRTPMYPYVAYAPHTAKNHTLITLGISIGANPLFF